MSHTIVLVHGAFADSSSWNGVIDPIQADGHKVLAAANPLRGLASDAQAVTDLVRSIDGPVVLVGHSYGGAVITNVDADAGDITGLVYVAAFAPEVGETAFELSAKYPGSTLGDAVRPTPRSDGTTDLTIAPELFHEQFAADVPVAETTRMAVCAASGDARGAPGAVGGQPALEARAVVVRIRRGGPQHPRRTPAFHGRTCRRDGKHAGRGCVARAFGVTARGDGPHDPRRRDGRRGGLTVGPEAHHPKQFWRQRMHEIRVSTMSPEEALAGVAELWVDGHQIAYTLLEDGDLMLRIQPRRDGGPVVVGARSLAAALAEVDQLLTIY